MTRKRSIFFLVILFLCIFSFSFFLTRYLSKEIFPPLRLGNTFSISENKNGENIVRVRRVIDGDTIELENGEKVRYIGINTPESVDPRRKVECFGKEASKYNKELVEGEKVTLVKDISERDKYGRLLRFVFLDDGTFVNEVLISEGYAFASSYPPDVSKEDIFKRAESKARSAKRGLWAEDTCNGKK